MEDTDKNKIKLTTRIACRLIGWNPDILQECGEASHRALRRYLSSITILAIIWGLIGFCFADRYIGIESLGWKCAASAVFITIIICIERFIILHVGKLGWTGVFRFLLAILMAALGSTVFDQIIFRHDTEVKMKEIRTAQIAEETSRRLVYLDKEIAQLGQDIDSLGKINIELYAELAKNPVIAATDVNTISTQTGTDSLGRPVYAKTTSVTKKNVENPLSARVKSNEAELSRQQTRLTELQERKLTTAGDVRAEYEAARVGFLEEFKALMSILGEDGWALAFYLVLCSFLLFLELLVVTSKSGDSTCDYDLIVEHQLRIKSQTLQNMERNLLTPAGSARN